MKITDLRGKTAIVGVGLGGLPSAPERSSMEIQTEAVHRALADAGLKPGDVDGLFTGSSHAFMPALSTAEYLGIRPKISDTTMIGGSSFIGHLLPATMALQYGLCDVALICYGSNQGSGFGKLKSMSEPQTYEAPYDPRHPITSYALAAARHMHQFGTRREDLAEVAVAARRWAQLNPLAFARDDLTIEQVMAAPVINTRLLSRHRWRRRAGAGAQRTRQRLSQAAGVYAGHGHGALASANQRHA